MSVLMLRVMQMNVFVVMEYVKDQKLMILVQMIVMLHVKMRLLITLVSQVLVLTPVKT